jgi:hypothetical protein
MKGMLEIVMKSEEGRIGRALKAVLSEDYKIDTMKNEAHEVRAYVFNLSKEYAVLINDSGKYFCACHDRFVNENICKHILMVIFEKLLKNRKEPKEENREEKAEISSEVNT